jgi:hypothetical protein
VDIASRLIAGKANSPVGFFNHETLVLACKSRSLFTNALEDQQPDLDRLIGRLSRCHTVELVSRRFQIIPRRMGGYIQYDGNLGCVLSGCDPPQTLKFSCRKARPIFAEHFGNDTPMNAVSNLNQRMPGGIQKVRPVRLRT